MSNTTKKQYTILGVSVLAAVPLDAATYDQYAGRVGACVDTALGYQIPRSWHSKVRAGVVAELKKLGHEPLETETQDKFVSRLRDENKISADDFAALVVRVADSIDALGCLAGTERASIGAQWLDKAQAAQQLWESGTKSFADSLAKWQKADASINVADPSDTEAVARALRAYSNALDASLV